MTSSTVGQVRECGSPCVKFNGEFVQIKCEPVFLKIELHENLLAVADVNIRSS
jgi:hypothetical protein